jgi:hypothetical protein
VVPAQGTQALVAPASTLRPLGVICWCTSQPSSGLFGRHMHCCLVGVVGSSVAVAGARQGRVPAWCTYGQVSIHIVTRLLQQQLRMNHKAGRASQGTGAFKQ